MSYKGVPVIIVAAVEKHSHGIGNKNGLIFHAPEDLKRFKQLTLGHPVIMGRNTFESILKILGKPLPNRTNIVITSNQNYHYENTKVANSLEQALSIALEESPTEIHIGGGAMIYKLALPIVDKLYLTLFDKEVDADTFFPTYENDFKIVNRSELMIYEGTEYQWVDLER